MQGQQALVFPRGNIYQIICQDGNQALRIYSNDPKEYDKCRVIGTQPNQHDLGQLWMIEKVGHNEDEFEIVNCQSNYVWDEEGHEVKLRFGKQKSDQLFKVEKVGNAFWFKTSAKGDQACALEGVLRYKPFDPNTPTQLFYIVPVDNCNGLNETCIIVNAYSGKAVDVPGATFDKGERLITWEKNKRFNQRWRWVQSYGGGYALQSVLNGQCLDIAEEKKEAGSKVVQWEKTNGSNQRWKPVPAGQGVYRIESCHAPGQFLAIRKDDLDNGGKLEINNQGQSLVWRIEGHVPQ